MIRLFILFILFSVTLFASQVQNFRWSNGETYLEFLEKNSLPLKTLYYNLDKDDQTLTEDIMSGVNCQILKNDTDILQILIPINDELQIHIYKNKDSYSFEAIPIISTTKTQAFTIKISHSPYYDIIKATGSKKLAQIFITNCRND